MVLPLIPVVLMGVGAVTGAGGAIMGVKGGLDIRKANVRIGAANDRYAAVRARLQEHEAETNDALKKLGSWQEEANESVVHRMADFLRRHEKQVKDVERLLVDGLESCPGQVAITGSLGQDAIAWMRGIVGTAVTGVGINTGMTVAVTSLASASTGTAISSLSGAAATNATMAFLGGGSIASGGGGMVAGAAALNFVTIGPALLVSGLVVAGQGEKAKTKAHESEAAVNVAIAEMDATQVVFDAIQDRANELRDLIVAIRDRATDALDLLESDPFDPERHAARFQRALSLTIAVRDIASAQVVNEEGNLDEGSARFDILYRPLAKEEDND
ncbi:hypothetical protein [Ornithinimicrobium sp. LYQ103]|uniref:hypothetical protein n=1 Tax=Ornithinimicrobium sp. LYQ103 TaxID=3378796 RepID=UPI003852B6E1